MHGERTPGERLRLSPFDALPDDGPPRRDQRDLMERPFFSLAKGRRVAPILYRVLIRRMFEIHQPSGIDGLVGVAG